ncbi:MAG TPA: hypothetical protein VFI12_05510, partial [Thermomicrobiales bacterium]|nr:hypothetical protein [Thermomicrobiales bacterium]
MAALARPARERPLAAPLERARRLRRPLRLLREPRPEPHGRLDEDEQAHVRVLEAAELAAAAAVDADPVGVEEDPVALARDRVDLAVQLGHPEAVDHVRRRRHEVDARADGDVDLVRRDRPRARI